jgi:hypothetical protein
MVEGAAIGAANKSTGVAPTVRGMTIRAENYGTNATEFGVLDVNASDEVGAGTLRYGLRVRSTDASGVAALDAGILLSNTSTYGFDYGMDMNGATIGTADIRLNNGATLANGAAGTLTITETAIDLVGALAADALTLSDVLTFSDGATIDNTAADTITITETNIDLTGATTVTGAFDATTSISSPTVAGTTSVTTPTAILTGGIQNPISSDGVAGTTAAYSGGYGNIIKQKMTSGAVTATSAGAIVKAYYEGGTITGNYEVNGLIVYNKLVTTLGGGAKSSLASFHRHSSSTGTVDYGARFFAANSKLTTLFYASGTMTNFFEAVADGSGGATLGSNAMTKSPNSDTEDGYLTIVVAGTSYQVPFYTA